MKTRIYAAPAVKGLMTHLHLIGIMLQRVGLKASIYR